MGKWINYSIIRAQRVTIKSIKSVQAINNAFFCINIHLSRLSTMVIIIYHRIIFRRKEHQKTWKIPTSAWNIEGSKKFAFCSLYIPLGAPPLSLLMSACLPKTRNCHSESLLLSLTWLQSREHNTFSSTTSSVLNYINCSCRSEKLLRNHFFNLFFTFCDVVSLCSLESM